MWNTLSRLPSKVFAKSFFFGNVSSRYVARGVVTGIVVMIDRNLSWMVEDMSSKGSSVPMSTNHSNRTHEIRRRRLGIMGKVLSIVGRKPQPLGATESDHDSQTDEPVTLETVNEKSHPILLTGEKDNIEPDLEFELLQSKTAAVIETKRKVKQIKELEQKHRVLKEQLKQLELKEMHIKGKQLKGQLKELQIKELKIKEGQLRDLSVLHDYDTELHLTILDRSDDINLSSAHPGDDSTGSLPEPLVGFHSDSFNGDNGLNDTLHTAMLEPLMENSIIRTLSRILQTDNTGKNSGSGAGASSKSTNQSGSMSINTVSLLPTLLRETRTPDTKNIEKFESTPQFSDNNSSASSFYTFADQLEDSKRKKQHRKMLINLSQLQYQHLADYLKIKIYVPAHDTVLALKFDKKRLTLIAVLILAVLAKAEKVLNTLGSPHLLLVSKQPNTNPVPLNNEQGFSGPILDYIRTKDKIHVLVE